MLSERSIATQFSPRHTCTLEGPLLMQLHKRPQTLLVLAGGGNVKTITSCIARRPVSKRRGLCLLDPARTSAPTMRNSP